MCGPIAFHPHGFPQPYTQLMPYPPNWAGFVNPMIQPQWQNPQ